MTKERGRLPFFPQFGQLVFIVSSIPVGEIQSRSSTMHVNIHFARYLFFDHFIYFCCTLLSYTFLYHMPGIAIEMYFVLFHAFPNVLSPVPFRKPTARYRSTHFEFPTMLRENNSCPSLPSPLRPSLPYSRKGLRDLRNQLEQKTRKIKSVRPIGTN